MTRLLELLQESEFNVYQGMVRITHTEDITVQDIGELLRAVPGVLTVTQVTHDSQKNTAVMKVKILTTKPVQAAFSKFKQNSVTRIPEIKGLEIATRTLEKKK